MDIEPPVAETTAKRPRRTPKPPPFEIVEFTKRDKPDESVVSADGTAGAPKPPKPPRKPNGGTNGARATNGGGAAAKRAPTFRAADEAAAAACGGVAPPASASINRRDASMISQRRLLGPVAEPVYDMEVSERGSVPRPRAIRNLRARARSLFPAHSRLRISSRASA